MQPNAAIIELGPWLQTAPGQQLLAWEQQQIDRAVSDAFGFHALQLGLPPLQALRANRMPHRWLALDGSEPVSGDGAAIALDESLHTGLPPLTAHLRCDADALPFPAQSLDLVVLPHTLERARDPHLALREVERVLRPEGRVMILGFNPASLWGLRQRGGHLVRGLGLAAGKPLYMPQGGEFINYWRLRDWLRLLSFEVEGGRFGMYRPAVRSPLWLQRWQWVEPVGERWWPVLGAVYFLEAVKRVRGMRLVGLARHEARAARKPAVAATPAAHTAPQQQRGQPPDNGP